MKDRFFPAFVGPRSILLSVITLAIILTAGTFSPARGQSSISSFNRERARQILEVLKSDIKKNYYDTSFHGIDLDAHFKKADEKVKEATSVGQAWGIIAQTLLDFNDSHLSFIPPQPVKKVQYGWQMQMIGDKCFVTAVKPGSDAEAKGLKPGDEIYSIDGYEPTRENIWKMKYFYYSLRPKAGIKIIVQDADGKQREILAMAEVKTGKQITRFEDIFDEIREAETESRLSRNRLEKINDDLIIWKLPTFMQSPAEMDSKMDQVRKHKALILDLRGNGGGYVVALERLVGNFFDRDVKIADLKGRKKMDPQEGKTREKNTFTGKVVVLVDSRCASAAEIFARVMQLEKRGIVIGDHTSGKVMQSMQYGHMSGVDIAAFYGASITNADVIMTDGKSLEHTGVAPDELLLPSGTDMKANRDPVLSRAATLLGVDLSPEKAGALFPVEWK